eukprot:gene2529-biopygen5701
MRGNDLTMIGQLVGENCSRSFYWFFPLRYALWFERPNPHAQWGDTAQSTCAKWGSRSDYVAQVREMMSFPGVGGGGSPRPRRGIDMAGDLTLGAAVEMVAAGFDVYDPRSRPAGGRGGGARGGGAGGDDPFLLGDHTGAARDVGGEPEGDTLRGLLRDSVEETTGVPREEGHGPLPGLLLQQAHRGGCGLWATDGPFFPPASAAATRGGGANGGIVFGLCAAVGTREDF